MTPLYCLYLILGITFLFNLSGSDEAGSVQNCVHPHLHRRKLLPCLNAHLYMMGDFFQLIKRILVSQKDLISSLWALSAKTWRVVIRTGLWGQTLVRGQSPGGDSCGGDRAGNVSPEAKSPRQLLRRVAPGCALVPGCGVSPSAPSSMCAGGWEEAGANWRDLGREQPGEQQPSGVLGARHPLWWLKIASAGPRAGEAAVGK